ncbi:MAG: HD domain-containing protein [Bacilli bacterium]|nr:HD domain-containing protein [Bacilli bacterium]
MNTIMKEYIDNLENFNKEEFLKILNDIDKKQLYNSPIHGLYHSEKVLLFSYLIGKYYNFNEQDMRIICDAAKYHDIGRVGDDENKFHGNKSSENIDSVIKYDDEYELALLKAIMNEHSRPDNEADRSFDDYFWSFEDEDPYYSEEKIREYKKRYDFLYKALKDADALDRFRLIGTCAALDEDYLRLDYSKELISMAEEINDKYIEYFENNPDLADLNTGEGVCYHGFGVDFFKLETILEHGILSFREMKKKEITGAQNFPGGNCRNYVSCVVEDLVKENEPSNSSAYKNFTMNSINIKTVNIKWFEASNEDNLPMALCKGRPYKKASYSDERYVRNSIEPEKFDKLFLSNDLANKKLVDCEYITPALNKDILDKRLGHYLSHTGNGIDKELDETLKEYYAILADHRNEEDNCNNKKQYLKDVKKKVLEVSNRLQPHIGKMVAKYYGELLNKDYMEITVLEALIYELQRLEYNTEFKEENNNLVCNIKCKVR